MSVRLFLSTCSLLLIGCGGPLKHYELANYGPDDTSAGDVTHASDSEARVVTPKHPTIVIGGCDDSLWHHVYNPARLEVHEACITLTGFIVDASHGRNKDGCRHEADGDAHCFLRLDAGQEKYINDKNIENENGAIVFEPMCRYRVTQEDAKAVCKNWKQDLKLPAVGSHVRATGAWVLDTQHGHFELHPISALEVIP